MLDERCKAVGLVSTKPGHGKLLIRGVLLDGRFFPCYEFKGVYYYAPLFLHDVEYKIRYAIQEAKANR